MNSITMTGAAMRSGVPFIKMPDLMRGTMNFDNAIQNTLNASKSVASQSRNYDTYKAEPITRTKLSDQDLAELAGKYDPHNMTQEQYDAFLDELVERGALTRSDTSWLGRGGYQRIDVDLDTLMANGGMGAGPIRIASLGNFGGKPKRSVEEAENDIMVRLESMLTQQSQEIGGSRQKSEALNTLYDIIRRM